MTRRSWEQLRDAIYVLEAATEDVAMDLVSGRATKAEYAEALRHLSAAARDVNSVPIEPTAVGGD